MTTNGIPIGARRRGLSRSRCTAGWAIERTTSPRVTGRQPVDRWFHTVEGKTWHRPCGRAAGCACCRRRERAGATRAQGSDEVGGSRSRRHGSGSRRPAGRRAGGWVRVSAPIEPLSDLPELQPLREERQHLPLPGGQVETSPPRSSPWRESTSASARGVGVGSLGARWLTGTSLRVRRSWVPSDRCSSCWRARSGASPAGFWRSSLPRPDSSSRSCPVTTSTG
jgi:hypothetical protein